MRKLEAAATAAIYRDEFSEDPDTRARAEAASAAYSRAELSAAELAYYAERQAEWLSLQ